MTMTIEVPQKVVDRAAKLGVPVESLVNEAIRNMQTLDWVPEGFVPLGIPTMTPDEAYETITEIQRNSTLGGLKIRDLINEGRRI